MESLRKNKPHYHLGYQCNILLSDPTLLFFVCSAGALAYPYLPHCKLALILIADAASVLFSCATTHTKHNSAGIILATAFEVTGWLSLWCHRQFFIIIIARPTLHSIPSSIQWSQPLVSAHRLFVSFVLCFFPFFFYFNRCSFTLLLFCSVLCVAGSAIEKFVSIMYVVKKYLSLLLLPVDKAEY